MDGNMKFGKCKNILLGTLFWIVSLTWGALLTVPGLLVALVAIIIGGKPHRNGWSFIVEIGGNWGGLEIGAIALCGCYSQEGKPDYSPSWFEHIRAHEFGHNLQQILFGPFQLFLVMVPSAIRYWYDRLHGLRHPYDYIWFEYTASKWGHKWLAMIEPGFNTPYTYRRK